MGVEIRTGRLRLRPLETGDAPRIRELAGDEAVARGLSSVPHPCPEGEAERFITACLEEGACVWAIERLAAPGLIGLVGIEGERRRDFLGYWIGRSFWGGLLGQGCWGQGCWGPGLCQRGGARSGRLGLRHARPRRAALGFLRRQ